MTLTRKRTLRIVAALALVVAACGVASLRSEAASPPSQAVTVARGQTSTVTWTGTVPAPSTHPTNTCNGTGTANADDERILLTIPRKGYARFRAVFTFEISWAPSSGDETANDLILTVNGNGNPDGSDAEPTELGSSDGSDTKETVVVSNLAPGTYTVRACGFNNLTPQDYAGKLTVTTQELSAVKPLASAPARGLAFSASVPTDPQRDEAEPLIEIDRAGNIYTCGPTGFGAASDYAQVSTDGGSQFHLLGTPPRGQQGFGGGGDCALATGVTKNAQGRYQYAYSGLGPLTGFTTSTSADGGHSIANVPVNGNGVPGATSNGALADRQWMTFLDDHTVLLSYNQQQPRNVVVQKSIDGGLTYSPVSSIAAPNPEFPGPLRYITGSATVYMPWTKGEAVNLAVSRDGGTTWTNCKVASGDAVAGGTAGFAVADHDSAGNVYVVWADSADYHTWMSVLPAAKLAGCNEPVDTVAGSDTGQPSVDPGFSAPLQVDRDSVSTTVFPWVAAGGAPGRVAVAFYGTTSEGDPNSGEFDAAWDVYVNQSLNALDAARTFSQVQATTHPFHYDSICLNGLGCDLAAPAGDRSLADFFAIAYNPVSGRLSVVFNRTNKAPDEALGRLAAPMVVTQAAGPSNGGTTLTAAPAALRSSSPDPTGDALSSYSLAAPGVAPPQPPTTNDAAGDFTSAAIGADAATQGFTVTLKVSDLSPGALTRALADTGAQSLLWVFRFTNGYRDAAASASWSPVAGWKFGFDDFTAGSAGCGSSGEKCQTYPQATSIQGSADQLTGTIRLVVPRSVLKQLSGADAAGRPLESAAATGARFYDATAFSLANNVSTTQAAQSFLYPLDNTPAMDFTLP
jgi:hypothetical protein